MHLCLLVHVDAVGSAAGHCNWFLKECNNSKTGPKLQPYWRDSIKLLYQLANIVNAIASERHIMHDVLLEEICRVP